MSAEAVFGPEPLTSDHKIEGFDCGLESLNDYLTRRALADQAAGKSRTYVVVRAGRVVGYFSLASAAVTPQQATRRAAQGQGMQSIPAILLGRLAVGLSAQGRGVGRGLLVEALVRAVAAARIIGARVVVAHAVNESAQRFYRAHGFESSPADPLHVMMLMKDIRKTLGVR